MQTLASSPVFQEGRPDNSEDGKARLLPAVATPRGIVGGYHVSMGVWREPPAQHWLTSACHLDTAVGAARNRSPELGVRA